MDKDEPYLLFALSTPLEALFTRMLHAKAEMDPADILLKDDLAEELAQAQSPAALLQEDSSAQREQERRLMKMLKIMGRVAAQRGDSGNLTKIVRIIGLIVIVIGALNRRCHFFQRMAEARLSRFRLLHTQIFAGATAHVVNALDIIRQQHGVEIGNNRAEHFALLT